MEQEPLIPGFSEPIKFDQEEQATEIKPPEKNNKTGSIIAIIALVLALGTMYIWQNKKPETDEQNNKLKIETNINADKNVNGKNRAVAGETITRTNPKGIYFIYFSKDGDDCNRVYPIERKYKDGDEPISTALVNLFFGPTETEKKAGYNSFFSQETNYILHSVKVAQGIAYVNIKDVRKIIPNASSSCGSAQLLAQIRETLQQFPGINDFRVAIDSDPEPFYEWLQIGCQDNLCDKTKF